MLQKLLGCLGIPLADANHETVPIGNAMGGGEYDLGVNQSTAVLVDVPEVVWVFV